MPLRGGVWQIAGVVARAGEVDAVREDVVDVVDVIVVVLVLELVGPVTPNDGIQSGLKNVITSATGSSAPSMVVRIPRCLMGTR
jgi:hypothetical protein